VPKEMNGTLQLCLHYISLSHGVSHKFTRKKGGGMSKVEDVVAAS